MIFLVKPGNNWTLAGSTGCLTKNRIVQYTKLRPVRERETGAPHFRWSSPRCGVVTLWRMDGLVLSYCIVTRKGQAETSPGRWM